MINLLDQKHQEVVLTYLVDTIYDLIDTVIIMSRKLDPDLFEELNKGDGAITKARETLISLREYTTEAEDC